MQVGRLGVHVGAHIEHQNLLVGVLRGEEGADGGAVDALEPAQAEDRGGHHGAGVAGRIHRRGLACLHQVHGQIDAGVALTPHHRGLFIHAHRGAAGHHFDQASRDGGGQLLAQAQGRHGLIDSGGFGHEAHPHRQQGHRPQAALQDRAGGMVAAHAIHGHPEPLGIDDPELAIGTAPLLQPAQGIKDQGLEHRVGHRAGHRARRTRHGAGNAGDIASHRTGNAGDIASHRTGNASHVACGTGDAAGGGDHRSRHRASHGAGGRGRVHQARHRRIAAIPDHQAANRLGPPTLGAAASDVSVLRGQGLR